MALTANTILRAIKPASSWYGVQGETPMGTAAIKNTIVVAVGDILLWDAGTGTVDIAGADNVAAALLLGVAATAGTGIAAPDFAKATVPNSPVRGSGGGIVNYYPALPGMKFVGHYVAAKTTGTDATAALTLFGKEAAIAKDATSAVYHVDGEDANITVAIQDIALNQIDAGSGTPPQVKHYASQTAVIAASVRNPLVIFTFKQSYWITA